MIIVDASVAIKWILSEEIYSAQAFTFLQAHLKNTNRILVPSLLFIEVTNFFATKSWFTSDEALRSLEFFFSFQLDVYLETEEDLLQAGYLAKKYNASAYDMLYAVVAEKHNAVLITADEKFVQKTNFPFVTTLKKIEENMRT